jgi:3-oxocholest-4-en-26-oyl-CoA dehydrogenase beta subunit
MDFSITNPQSELSALSRRILTDHTTPSRLAELEHAGAGLDPELWAQLASAGVLSAALPDAVGGDGFGLAEQCSILVEVGRAVAPVPYLESIVLGASAIANFGTADQVTRYAITAAAGDLVIASALGDQDDEAASPVKADRTAAGWRLSGAKTTVTAGTSAGLFLVTAATRDGTGVFLVESADPDVTIEPQRLMGQPGAARLVLDGLELGADRLLGEADGAVTDWLTARATVGLCALQLGVTERALELTAAYAQSRQQFGRAIGAFQAVAQRLADAYIDVEAIRLTMWQAAWRLETGLAADAEIATAKFWASDAGHRVAHTTVHVHGGVGIDVSHPAHRYYAASKRLEFALGGSTAQLRRLGAILAS